MKSILFTIAITIAGVHSHAQITLSSTSYPSTVYGTDSLKVTTHSSAFSSFAAMSNGTWDMSIVTDSTPVFFAYRVPSSGYRFADSNWYSFAGYGYQANIPSNISSAGVIQLGEQNQRTWYSLTSLTLGATDSLIFDAQTDTFSTPRTKIGFPATINSSWTSSYRSDLNFHLTFLLAGYNHSPCMRRKYVVEKDSVTGWGKMRVLDAGGSPSPYQHVLQVQTLIIETDSFFLNGSPLPPALLTAFSLTQGRKDTVYEQNYYREQELTPLAQVEFKDAAYTQPYKATTHVQRFQSDVAVPQLGHPELVSVYPNPAIGSTYYITIPEGVGSWAYELCDVTGRVANKGRLKAGVNELQHPSLLVPGIYFVRVKKDGSQVVTKQLELR